MTMRPRDYARRAAVMTCVTFAVASCGVGRPDIEEIASALRQPDSIVPVTAERADCVAQVLHDSDVSNKTLDAIVEKDPDYAASVDEQNTLTQAVAQAQTACV